MSAARGVGDFLGLFKVIVVGGFVGASALSRVDLV